MTFVPANITACMSPDDQRAFSPTRRTPEETREAAAAKDEREIQRQVANYLRLLRVPFNQDAMNKRRTGTLGWPDFTFPYRGRCDARARFVAWEVKPVWSQKLRPEQSAVAEAIKATGAEWRLITSVADAQAHLREIDEIAPREEQHA